jgi:hypothetical protein
MTARAAHELHKRLGWIEDGRFICAGLVVAAALLVRAGVFA